MARSTSVENMIDRLSTAELRSIVKRITYVLYLEEPKHLGDRATWDPDKEWDSDTISFVADVLGFFGIFRAVQKARGKQV